MYVITISIVLQQVEQIPEAIWNFYEESLIKGNLYCAFTAFQPPNREIRTEIFTTIDYDLEVAWNWVYRGYQTGSLRKKQEAIKEIEKRIEAIEYKIKEWICYFQHNPTHKIPIYWQPCSFVINNENENHYVKDKILMTIKDLY